MKVILQVGLSVPGSLTQQLDKPVRITLDHRNHKGRKCMSLPARNAPGRSQKLAKRQVSISTYALHEGSQRMLLRSPISLLGSK